MIDTNTPRLSRLPGNLFPDQCAECGASHKIERWQEHDHRDKPEARVVVLCGRCSDLLIAPHPRLYRKLTTREFVPGSAAICTGCKHQSNLSCVSPLAQFNGGPGLDYKPMPLVAHMNCGRNSRWTVVECAPVEQCSGKERA